MEGQEIIPSVVGPMSHSPASLALFTKTVVAAEPVMIPGESHTSFVGMIHDDMFPPSLSLTTHDFMFCTPETFIRATLTP